MQRIAALVAIVASLVVPGIAFGQTEKQEPEPLAKAIAEKAEWAADLQICPSKLMARREATDHLVANECNAGDLSGCLRKCTAGKPGACYWLAYELEQRSFPSRTYDVLYLRACKLGVMSGCTNRAAGILEEAGASDEARTCAAATFDKVCALDDPRACTMNALLLSRGIGVPQDIPRALKSLQKSCKYGPEDKACVYAGRIRRDIEAMDGAKP
ncbi:MAG: hypothetical protein AMXMBFR59_14010 [Rhodanobacteraceae bacterium]